MSSKKLAALAAACDEQFVLRCTYEAPDKTTERTVEPTGLVHSGRRWCIRSANRVVDEVASRP